MDLNSFQPLAFPGASLDRGDGHYVLRMVEPLQFLSSATLGEGLLRTQWVLSYQVEATICLPRPAEYLRERARRLDMPEELFIGLLTAVNHRDLQVYTEQKAGVTVTTLATVGADHGSRPGQQRYGQGECVPVDLAWMRNSDPAILEPGTINIVTLIDADLTAGALVRASTMATEAKTLALVEAGIKTKEGYLATGTATDVTVVGHTGRGLHCPYAGSATLVGSLVGRGAYHVVRQGLEVSQRRDYS